MPTTQGLPSAGEEVQLFSGVTALVKRYERETTHGDAVFRNYVVLLQKPCRQEFANVGVFRDGMWQEQVLYTRFPDAPRRELTPVTTAPASWWRRLLARIGFVVVLLLTFTLSCAPDTRAQEDTGMSSAQILAGGSRDTRYFTRVVDRRYGVVCYYVAGEAPHCLPLDTLMKRAR